MIKPVVVHPDDEVTTVGHAFSTPLVVKGKTWIPITPLITWPIMAWVAGKRRPERTWVQRMGVGALTMPIVLGSEWGHNLAHAAAASLVGKPMDAIRITWGMPPVVYFDLNDETVTPRQHIIRALGGPLFNAFVLPIASLLQRLTKPESLARDLTSAAIGMNSLLLTVALLPIPAIDGGPLLKWSLVERGSSITEADRTVRKVDGMLGTILALAGAAALKKRRWLLGGLLVQFAVMALGFAFGILKEHDDLSAEKARSGDSRGI